MHTGQNINAVDARLRVYFCAATIFNPAFVLFGPLFSWPIGVHKCKRLNYRWSHLFFPSGCTALHIGAGSGSDYIVRMLLSKGALVDVADVHGQTATHYAVSGCQLKTLQSLLPYKPNLDAMDNTGRTMLHKSLALGRVLAVHNTCTRKGKCYIHACTFVLLYTL